MHRHCAAVLLVTALIVAGCGSSNDDDAAPEESPDGDSVVTEDTSTTTTTTEATEPAFQLPDYVDAASAVQTATVDRELPPADPVSATGAYGYSRYVYIQSGDDVVPTLLEGPLGRQWRCQALDQDCSYQELKALYDSGAEVPDYLGMDRETLGDLVGQLDRVNAAVMQYDSIDAACAAGFSKSTNQNANMGIHMIDEFLTEDGFDPDRPQMVLFAKEGGERVTGAELGDCEDGRWTGEDGFGPVGAVFNLRLTDEHPEGFAGPIDNWHVHYNTCIGRTSVAEDGSNTDDAAGNRLSTTEEACTSAGGQFLDVIPSWMMHAYVADDFEAQAGVFSMFNPTVWPLSDNDGLLASRTIQTEGALDAPISNFNFGSIEATAGEPVRFNNSDAVPHTVTAGTAFEPLADFDSGVLATGQSYDVTFAEAGEYQLFCVLHPDMQGTVVVSG